MRKCLNPLLKECQESVCFFFLTGVFGIFFSKAEMRKSHNPLLQNVKKVLALPLQKLSVQ